MNRYIPTYIYLQFTPTELRALRRVLAETVPLFSWNSDDKNYSTEGERVIIEISKGELAALKSLIKKV